LRVNKIGNLVPVSAVPTLVDSVAAAIRASILQGQFVPGQRLVEAELARELHVSRGPVREALASLVKEGIVTNVPRRGKFVEDFTLQALEEIYMLRRILEPYAGELLVRHLDTARAARLERAVDAIGAAVRARDRAAVIHRDVEFHNLLHELTDNDLLQRVWRENIAGKLRLWLNISHRTFDDAEMSHRALVEPILQRDSATVKARLEAHIDAAWSQARAAFAEQPLLVADRTGAAPAEVEPAAVSA